MKTLLPLTKDQVSDEAKPLFEKLEKKLGRVINIYAAMGHSPKALEALLTFGNILRQGELTPTEAEAIALVVGQVNDCHYCVSAHSQIAQSLKMSDEQINQLRLGQSDDEKLNALVVLAKEIATKNGYVDSSVIDDFLKAGYSKAALVEVVGFVTLNLMTNMFNHMADVENDFPEPPALN